MGKRGTKSKHPSGNGWINAAGYHRFGVWDPVTKSERRVFAHVLVWERERGAIPPGHQVHHINGIRHDNRIDNLECVDATTHKRIHSGCEMRDGVWWKRCGVCGEFFPIDLAHWYISREGWPLYGRCRPCHIARVVNDKRERAQRRRAVGEGG